MNMLLFWKVMFFTSPLITGSVVALSRSVSVVGYLDRFHNWLFSKQQQFTNTDGYFKKFVVKPITNSLLIVAAWTQGIKNEFVRSGVRISSYIYFLMIFLALLAAAVYVVVIVAISILIIWLFWFKLVPMIFESMNGSSGSYKQDNSSHKPENSGVTKTDMRSDHSGRNGNFFETKSERLMRLHNNGEQDAANSESTLLGETNRHVPNFGISESEREENEAYKNGFENGRKNRNK